MCQHCKYQTVSKNNFILHNEAIHGVTINDQSFEERGMEAAVPKAETVVSEAPSQEFIMPFVTSWKIEEIEEDITQ